MTMIGKLRRMLSQRTSLREISPTTSLSRDTVRKYLRTEPKYKRKSRVT